MTVTSPPVLHIHPTRMCNLACAHCYSRSGPSARNHLPIGQLLTGTQRLFTHGYRQASLSGGEPMLYPDIAELCRGLSRQGYHVSVISNGWFCNRIAPLAQAGHIHSVSLSFDGLPCIHDLIRCRKGAFRKSLDGLETLTRAGITTGAVVAVTRACLPQLPDLVAVLREAGATQIQFHPVAAVGRANDTPDTCAELDEEQMLRLLLLTEAFRKLNPDTGFATDALTGIDIDAAIIGQTDALISPLVIDENGALHPFAYGMDQAHCLGTLQKGFRQPRITNDLAGVIAATQATCGSKLASAFFPELVHHSQHSTTGAG